MSVDRHDEGRSPRLWRYVLWFVPSLMTYSFNRWLYEVSLDIDIIVFTVLTTFTYWKRYMTSILRNQVSAAVRSEHVIKYVSFEKKKRFDEFLWSLIMRASSDFAPVIIESGYDNTILLMRKEIKRSGQSPKNSIIKGRTCQTKKKSTKNHESVRIELSYGTILSMTYTWRVFVTDREVWDMFNA